MTDFQQILSLSPSGTAWSQVALNRSWLSEEYTCSVSPSWVLQNIVLDVPLAMDKPTGCRGRERGREEREDIAGSCPWESERLPHSVDVHYIKIYLLSAKCAFWWSWWHCCRQKHFRNFSLGHCQTVVWSDFAQIVGLPLAENVTRTRWKWGYCTVLNVDLKQVKYTVMLIKYSDLKLKTLSSISYEERMWVGVVKPGEDKGLEWPYCGPSALKQNLQEGWGQSF